MNKTLIVPESLNDIPDEYRGTPIETLIGVQNGFLEHKPYANPELLLVTCMDNRIMLKLPPRFAFVLRTAGARITRQDFPVAFTVAIGGVKAFAVMGHDDCGMTTLDHRKDKFVQGLKARAGWDEGPAAALYQKGVEMHGVDEAVSFTAKQAEKLKTVYPGLTAAALFYRVHTGKISLILRDPLEKES